MPVYKVSLAGNPNSCMIKIGKTNFRTLVDSGAEVSLMHQRVFQNLKDKPKLIRKKVYLQSVNGNSLTVVGCTDINFEMRGLKMTQKFYIVKDLNRNFILGRDWLTENRVRLYFDLGCLRVGKTYVPLEEDIHIASIVRLASTAILKPQTTNICSGHIKYIS